MIAAGRFIARLGVLALLLACAPGAAAQEAFHAVASRTGVVRSEPDAAGPELFRLRAGQALNIESPLAPDGFYPVRLAGGRRAWISKYVVRLHEGPAPTRLLPPEATAGGAPAEPDEPEPGEGEPAGTGAATSSTAGRLPGDALTAQQRAWAREHLLIGRPLGYELIVRRGYVIGYDPRLKSAAWVQYRLTRERSADDTFPRSDDFRPEPVVPEPARADLDDYADSDYVRGHLAPADDSRWDEQVERDTYFLSNMAPMIGSSFNGSVWKTLEGRAARWAEARGDLTIIMGPVYTTYDVSPNDDDPNGLDRQPSTPRRVAYNVIGDSATGVGVPNGFFKVIVDMAHPARPDVLAFYFPHRQTVAGPERRLETYLTSVDRVEELTGLDLLSQVPDDAEAALEALVPAQPWPLP